MRTYDYRHLVPLEETNLVGNVYFTNYLRWQGHCRERFLAEHAPGVVRALSVDLALVTVSCRCDYFAELFGLDQVEIRMSLGQASGNRVTMLFDYYRLHGSASELVARGAQTIACMTRSRSPIDIPEELAAALRPYTGRSTHE